MESNRDKSSEISQLHEGFNNLEKACLGFENYVNAEEKNYIETLNKLKELVVKI
jgi:hypothetical protein